MARNVCGVALLVMLALAGCSNKKEEQAAKASEAKLTALRARTIACARLGIGRILWPRFARSRASTRSASSWERRRPQSRSPSPSEKKKPVESAPISEEMILTQAQTACSQDAGPPPTTMATAQPAAATPAAKDTAKAVVAAAPAPAASPAAPVQPALASPAADSAVWADSVRKAKEIEMSRETFAYGGSARDPFNSLLNMAKSGPELADLQLVGIYQNLRLPTASVAVFREKDGGKRHKLRAGDQVGRSRLVQIRDRDVVFMIEDFGFERQETLSLRKQEDVTP